PMYEIDAPPTSFDKLLFEDAEAKDQAQAAAAQTRAEASFAALQGHTMMGIEAGSWAATLADVQTKLQPVYEAEHAALVKLLTPYVNAEAMALKQQGCTPDMYYCASLQKDYRQALSERLSGHLEGAIDLWGKAYQVAGGTFAAGQLTTSGPDEVAGNADDATITLAFSDFGGEAWAGVSTNDAGVAFEPPIADGDFAGGPQAAGGGVGNFGGAAGTGGAGAFDNGNGTGSDDKSGDGTPRVRKEFPETLYVNPAIITDADGKATISVDMADSITSWRVSALANAADGKLGGGQSGITVFQDFFVDVSFPAELTRGDEVDFPIVLYNYLKTQQTVKLTIEQAPWFTALGSVNPSVTLAAGEVKSINVPVRVEQVGTQALRVTAIGSKLSDAVERAVRVVPDGKAFPLAQSGSLGKGSTQLTVTFPANAVAGSGVLYLDVFPAFLAQAVSGLDSLLQVPSGCFEQTTSTTWPNVLVEHYMEQTKQITPEIQMKAESLVSAGYQRLLTFEHKGGGFSWFGEQDPAPFLSVTAFGLMEFADMASVTTVDSAMRTRTRDWLVAQQKSDGSWPGDMS
ncbi:MAG TPA: alpha-2-macroglobulin family protein, partial [Polyangiales bacterium]|nr:alpha-2-macroglobulin family protein [Polyangiales bacterium]